MRIRPSRWAWTSVAGAMLLVALLFVVLTLISDFSRTGAGRGLSGDPEPTLAAIGAGWLGAAIPTAVALVVAWRIRRRGEGIDSVTGAAFGVGAVLVLGIGIALALVGYPGRLGKRVTAETAIWLSGAVLLGTSMWVRHVPRPWWRAERGQRLRSR